MEEQKLANADEIGRSPRSRLDPRKAHYQGHKDKNKKNRQNEMEIKIFFLSNDAKAIDPTHLKLKPPVVEIQCNNKLLQVQLKSH